MFSSLSKGILRGGSKDIPASILFKGTTNAQIQPQIQIMRGPTITPAHTISPERISDEAFPERLQMSPGPKIIAVGGGKGGIGKSFLSANLGVSLAQKGHKVSLVDLDLGAANLHTCLGVPSPKVDLFDFLRNQVENLEDVGVPCAVPGLTLYGGGQEFWQQVRPQSVVQKIRLISKLQRLDSDYVILDLGAGTHLNTLDFFIFSHAGIVVIVPEPTSIENAYVFMKAVLLRRLQSVLKVMKQEEEASSLIATLEDPKLSTAPFALIQDFANRHPDIGQKLIHLMQMTQLGVIINQARTPKDRDIGTSMVQICHKYFGFSAEFLGTAAYDDCVWKSVRNRRLLQVDYPDSSVARSLDEIAQTITSRFMPSNINREQKVSSK